MSEEVRAQWDDFKKNNSNMTDSIEDDWDQLMDHIKSIDWDEIKESFNDLLDSIEELLKDSRECVDNILDTLQTRFDSMVEFLTIEVGESKAVCFHGQYCFEYSVTETEEGQVQVDLNFYKDEEVEHAEPTEIEGCDWLKNNVLIKKEAHFLANQLEEHLEGLEDGDFVSVSYSESWQNDMTAEESLSDDVETEGESSDLILEVMAEMTDEDFEYFVIKQYSLQAEQETVTGRTLSMVSELNAHDWALMFATFDDDDWAEFFGSFTPEDWNDWFSSFGDQEWEWFLESMKDGKWNEMFSQFNEEAWSWWFSFLSYDDFANFCEELNDSEWDNFFSEIGIWSTINFINAWTDDMWAIAEDKLDESTFEFIENYYTEEGWNSFLWSITDDEWR
jgi:hypothetical protein